jgi:hypothetical protein
MPTPEPGPPRHRRTALQRRIGVAALMLALLLALLLGVTRLASAQAPAATGDDPPPRIGLVTMSPGIEYWARFGHNALLVDDGRERILYNYGYFDFAQPGFLTRFLRGRMLYQLVALPIEVDLRGYAADGRGATLQWLDLAPAQARELAAFLRWNALPENADYRYDYFVDNCSTRVRDALDRALGGALQRELSGRSHGYTFRDEARRLAATLPWMYLGIDLGLGPFTDKPLSLWQESFIPSRLHDAVAEVRLEGRALVSAEVELLPQRLPLPPDAPPDWRLHFLFAGIAIGIALAFALRPAAARATRRIATACVAMLWLLCGVAGLGLLALWAFTDHAAAWGNENALLFNPLCLALLAGVASLWRGHAASRAVSRIALAVALCAGLAWFLKFLPFRIQANADWIALMLPIHALLAWRLNSTRRGST